MFSPYFLGAAPPTEEKKESPGDPWRDYCIGRVIFFHYFKSTKGPFNKENAAHKFSPVAVMPEGTYQVWPQGLYTIDENFDFTTLE